jgi:hypothetical protein
MMKAWRDSKVNGSIIPTRDYTVGNSDRPRTLAAGTTVFIVDIHEGESGEIVHISVRDPKTGEYFRRVPIEVFAR